MISFGRDEEILMLTVQCLEVVAEAVTPISLEPYCGSALRGAFFQALWKRFCTNRESPTCSACPLVAACPVASLVAPLRDEAPRGRDIPRPYVISPPYKKEHHYEPGEMLTFRLTLIGNNMKLFPYVIRSFQEMERSGFGHPLPGLHGHRGRFSVCQVRAYHPFTPEQQVLWESGSTHPQKPLILVTFADIAERAKQIPTDQITMDFLSPTRLIVDGQLLKSPDFRVLVLRLLGRLEQLFQEYGEHGLTSRDTDGPVFNRDWYDNLGAEARDIRLVRDGTHWVDIKSYSARQKQYSTHWRLYRKGSF
jgi:hypothetical protein